MCFTNITNTFILDDLDFTYDTITETEDVTTYHHVRFKKTLILNNYSYIISSFTTYDRLIIVDEHSFILVLRGEPSRFYKEGNNWRVV